MRAAAWELRVAERKRSSDPRRAAPELALDSCSGAAHKSARDDASRAARRFARDDAATAAHFGALLERHGPVLEALDWGSRASQEQRFAALAEVGDLHGARVLDLGCGLGDLCAWLEARGIDCEYTGVDLVPGMVESARARFPRRRFECANVLERSPFAARSFDYVLASGLLYRRRHQPYAYARALAERMLALARHGVAFNSLRAFETTPRVRPARSAPAHEAAEFRADPLRLVRACAGLAPRYALRCDYSAGDCTLYLRHAHAEAEASASTRTSARRRA